MTRRSCYWCADPIEAGEITCEKKECRDAARADSCHGCGELEQCAADCPERMDEAARDAGMPEDHGDSEWPS